MAKKKILKSTQNKLTNAVEALKAFSNAVVSGKDIILNDLYKVNDSGDPVTFTLNFNNIGVSTSTDIFLDNNLLQEKVHGSITGFPVGSNKEVRSKFLKIFSSIVTTPLTPLPAKLKVDFIISGGDGPVTYEIPSFDLKQVGDTVNLDISIFFLHL